MNGATFSIIVLALLEYSCIGAIVNNTMEPQHLSRLFRAAADISMTCYGDPGNAVGVIGDADGLILKALRSNRFIPVVLVDIPGMQYDYRDTARSHQLRVFVIALRSSQHFIQLIHKLKKSIWWNYYANFIIVDTRPELRKQCKSNGWLMYVTTVYGMLNVQFICHRRSRWVDATVIFTSNPFARRAPEEWTFVSAYKVNEDLPTGFLFARRYLEGGRSCQSISFDKTGNLDGYPLRFVTTIHPSYLQREFVFAKSTQDNLGNSMKLLMKSRFNEHRWLIDNIATAFNVSPVITEKELNTAPSIYLHPNYMSNAPDVHAKYIDRIIMPLSQMPMYAVAQHTGHKSQLEKILSVIDEDSRTGMWVVYLITFLFFKFFLRQAVMPAILNLVRLTCNTGLTKLPENFAPTIYLAYILMFVVTLQAIYTGNLATLLTTTIPYPNVQRKEDIAKWGYKIYIGTSTLTKLTADPMLDGSVIEIPRLNNCMEYVLKDPLAICVMDDAEAIIEGYRWKVHISREPILHEYIFFMTSGPNLLQRRIEGVLRSVNEAGLHRWDGLLDRLRLMFVDDDEVRKNSVRRVMTVDDLSFAFVILGAGLLVSFVCFIGEIVVFTILSKNAERHNRLRARTAW